MVVEWLKEHPGLVVSIGLGLLFAIAGVVIAPVVVARLPVDFFTREDRKPPLWLNVLGWVMVVAGVAMLILPGPGVVLLLVGVMLADFPGKRKALNWFLSIGTVFEGMNRVRAKRGKPALLKAS